MKQCSKYKKPSIPNFNPNRMSKEQRSQMNQMIRNFREGRNNASNHNLRKAQ